MASRTVSREDTQYFNPSVGGQAPDFTRDSRGVDPLQGTKQVEGTGVNYQGLGNIWEMIVNGSDAVIKQDIKSTVYDVNDSVMDAELGYKKPPPGVQESSAPDDLVRRGERLKNLQAARQAGRLTDSHYYALLDVESRKLRDRYPGHRDYIDSTMEGITGFSAQKYRAELASEASQAGAAFSKDEAYVRQNEEYISESTLSAWQQGAIPFDKVQLEASRKKRKKSHIELMRSELSYNKEEAEAGKPKTRDLLRKEIDYVMMEDGDGGTGFADMQAQLSAAMERGKNLDPEASAEFSVRLSSWIQKKRMDIANVGLGGRGTNYGKLGLTAQEIAEEQKPFNDALNIMEEGLKNKDWGILYRSKVWLDALSADTQLEIRGNDAMNFIAGFKDTYGEQTLNGAWFQNWLTNGDAKKLLPQQSYFIQQLTNKMAKGEMDWNQAQDEMMRLGMSSPAANRQLQSLNIHLLNDPNLPPETAKKLIASLYKGDPKEWLKRIGKTPQGPNGEYVMPQTYAIFGQMTNPVVAKNIITKGDPESVALYKKYTVNGVNALGSEAISNAKNAITSPEARGISVRFNEDTAELEVVARPGADAGWQTIYENHVMQFNMATKPMKTIFELEGGDLNQKMMGLYGQLGIDLNAPRDQDMGTTIYNGIVGGIKEHWGRITTQEGSDRGDQDMMRLGGPTGRQEPTEGGGTYPDILPRANGDQAKTGPQDNPIGLLREELTDAMRMFKENPTPETKRYLETIFDLSTKAKEKQDALTPAMEPQGEFQMMRAGADGAGGEPPSSNVIQFPDQGKVARDLGVPDSWLRDQKEILKEGPKINDRLTVREAYSKALNYGGYTDPANVKPLSQKAAMSVATDFKIDLKGMDVMSKQVREGLGHLRNQAAAVAQNPGSQEARRTLAQNIHTVQSMIDHAQTFRGITNNLTEKQMEMRKGERLSGPTGVVNTERAIGAGGLKSSGVLDRDPTNQDDLIK
jgi:hypothetical protein